MVISRLKLFVGHGSLRLVSFLFHLILELMGIVWAPYSSLVSIVCCCFYKLCDIFSAKALECLVRLASVRRSLFADEPARSRFLAHLMAGTKEILQSGQGLFQGLAAFPIVIMCMPVFFFFHDHSITFTCSLTPKFFDGGEKFDS